MEAIIETDIGEHFKGLDTGSSVMFDSDCDVVFRTGMKKSGFSGAKAKLAKLGAAVQSEFDNANSDNAKLLVDMARVLIPQVSGENRRHIKHSDAADGAQLVDFGPKAKVIEGDKGPRPFVNPALKLTKKARRARNRKALKQAIKKV